MIVVTARRMAAIAQAYHSLKECGRDADADELMASFREEHAIAPEPAPEPTKRPKEKTPEQLAKDAERARLYRERNGSTPRVTLRHGVTNSVTERDVQRDEFASRARSQEAEENRNLCNSGQSSAEIESSEKCVSSELRARPSVTSRVTERDESRDGQRDALRVLNRLQNCIGLQWDFGSYRTQLEAIACKPESEFAIVLENMAGDVWVKDNQSACSPKHVLAQWNRYLKPPKGKRAPVDETPVTRRYVNHDADAQMRRELAADQAGLYGIAGGKR